MKNKIAFIAVGQAGGNIGRLFEDRGYSVLYINTSQEDLDTLTTAKYKYHIPGGEGCNKDRHKAKQLVVDDFDRIAAEIDSKIKQKMIFVIFASGGGTGSGAGPMLIDLLTDEDRTVGAITIIPGENESVKSHINAYECFAELVEIDATAACFILDNSKGEKMKLNPVFVDGFCSFLEIPETYTSEEGNIDKAEIEETLKAHGMAVAIRRKADSSAKAISALKDNIFAPIEEDRTVKYIAAALPGKVSMSDLQKAAGVPIDTFQTVSKDEAVMCLSGLSYPTTRLESVYGRVDENRDTIIKNLAAAKETSLKKDVNFLDGLSGGRKASREQEPPKRPKARRDIMSKYLS